jgi:hypothetical protein
VNGRSGAPGPWQMDDKPASWKVAILGPTGVAVKGSAFRLLYSFPTREEAEEHAECFRHSGGKFALCDENGKYVNFVASAHW